MISASIILDSRNAITQERLTTFELKYPRFIHAEMMTHRCKSINAASSRAIPIEKMLEASSKEGDSIVRYWGKKHAGMVASEQLGPKERAECKKIWSSIRREVEHGVQVLASIGADKQVANRWLEPASHITVMATFPERGLRNFFALRAQAQAQPEFQCLAYDMLELWLNRTPDHLYHGAWHLPMIHPDERGVFQIEDLLKIATGRLARTSYLTHHGQHSPEEDIKLHDRLKESGHWSPFEHCAKVTDAVTSGGNFGPHWLQYRKTFSGECQTPNDDMLELMLKDRPEWTKGEWN